jgi:predicted kinase
MSDRIVYLMRGLPSCGKSFKARQLAANGGLICETDEYFHTQIGDDPTKYNYRRDLQQAACDWNFDRFCHAVDEGTSPIIVDRGNSRSLESQRYVRYAANRGYRVEIVEPDSPWWQEIRVLLKYKRLTKPALYEWADRLSDMSRETHRVPASTIRGWMDSWKWDLTVQEILEYEPEPDAEDDNDSPDDPEPAQETIEPMAAQPTPLTLPPPEPSEEPLQESPILKPGERSPFL